MRHGRRDGNESHLISLALGMGAYWVQAPPLDGWIFFRGKWTPVEIKNPEGKDELTKAQIRFRIQCNEHQAPHFLWRTLDDVCRDLGAKVTA